MSKVVIFCFFRQVIIDTDPTFQLCTHGYREKKKEKTLCSLKKSYYHTSIY